MSPRNRVALVEPNHPSISIARQVELLDLARSTVYYKPVISQEDLKLMRLIDQLYTRAPFLGSRRLTAWLNREGEEVNRKRVQRLMRVMGIEAIYCKKRLSVPHPDHRIYPYLLRNLKVERVNQVWGSDITYIGLSKGWVYLVAIIDWFSRYVVSWKLSNSLETDFCVCALEEAFGKGRPEIFNTDQGSQFTSLTFTGKVLEREIQISMDGRGRCFDNIFTERLWRSLKYEEVYLRDYEDVAQAREGIGSYLRFYNQERLHQSLGYKTPEEVYLKKGLIQM